VALNKGYTIAQIRGFKAAKNSAWKSHTSSLLLLSLHPAGKRSFQTQGKQIANYAKKNFTSAAISPAPLV